MDGASSVEKTLGCTLTIVSHHFYKSNRKKAMPQFKIYCSMKNSRYTTPISNLELRFTPSRKKQKKIESCPDPQTPETGKKRNAQAGESDTLSFTFEIFHLLNPKKPTTAICNTMAIPTKSNPIFFPRLIPPSGALRIRRSRSDRAP